MESKNTEVLLGRHCSEANADVGAPMPSARLVLAPPDDKISRINARPLGLKKFKDQEAVEDADFKKFSEVYAGILRQLSARHPSVRFVLCEPFLLPCGIATPAMVEDMRNRAVFVRQLAQDHDAVFVPFQSAFDAAMKKAPAAHWAYDGIHPTAAGFWLLAETWLNHVVRHG
jgi:hypothetical protein